MGNTIDVGTGSVSKAIEGDRGRSRAIEGSGSGAVAGPAMGLVTRLVRVSGLVSATRLVIRLATGLAFCSGMSPCSVSEVESVSVSVMSLATESELAGGGRPRWRWSRRAAGLGVGSAAKFVGGDRASD